MRPGPDFMIIGAMKAGTSTLHQQLARQPGIFMSTPKEPNFFSDDDQFARGLDWYASLFAGATDGDLCGESSTHYTKLPTYPQTLSRMLDILPDLRLVYLVRHPVDRLVSHYIHAWTENWTSDPIDRAVDTYEPLIAYSRYAMQLRPWLETYGPERIRVIFFDRLASDPVALLGEVADHIGYRGEVQWFEEAARDNVSSERLRKSGLRDRLVNMPVLREVRQFLIPQAAREWVKGFWRMQQRPQLSSAPAARLESVFDEDLRALGDWTDVTLSCARWSEIARETRLDWGPSVPHPRYNHRFETNADESTAPR